MTFLEGLSTLPGMVTKTDRTPTISVDPINCHGATCLPHVCQATAAIPSGRASWDQRWPALAWAMSSPMGTVPQGLNKPGLVTGPMGNPRHGEGMGQVQGPAREPSWEQPAMGPEIGLVFCCCQAVQRLLTHSS